MLDALEQQSWAPMTTLNVTVSQGVADIWGTITNEEERHAIRVLVENTSGVAGVTGSSGVYRAVYWDGDRGTGGGG